MNAKTFAVPLFVLAPLSAPAARPAQDYFSKSLSAAGGADRFRRLESLQYEFVETRFSGAGAVTVRGRHSVRLHDAGGLRGRLEIYSPAGDAVTVHNSSGVWHRVGGVLTDDPALLARAERDALERAFWALLPFNIREAGCSVSYGGLEYFQHKLTRRLDVAPCAGLVFAEGLSLYVDSDSHQVDGAVVPGPEGPRTVVFADRRDTNLIRLALRRETLAEGKKRTSSLVISNPGLNVFVDEGLFQPPHPTE
ncbi:MAG: hypothetical protein ACT4O3_04205 [Elusimicrobiota bacterium]